MVKIRSFTLVELIVVTIIIAILATIAMPAFRVTRERALDNEAKANLKLIRAAERIYRMEMGGTYIACANTSAVNGNLKLDIPTAATSNWNYKVDNVTSTAFTGKAQRNVTSGRVWCINQDTEEPVQAGCLW